MSSMNVSPKKLLPKERLTLLKFGFAILFSVYYFNYMGSFSEGDLENTGPFATLFKFASVAIVFGALAPRFRIDCKSLLIGLYGFFAISFLFSIVSGDLLNDVLFLNTLIQIPVFLAVTQSRWRIDFPALLRFIGFVLAVQIAIDTLIWQSEGSLWLSGAFIGGSGNPSAFGFECVLMLAFYLLHPFAGKRAFFMALVMLYGAVMTKSLFALLAAAMIIVVWALKRPRRTFYMLGLVTAVNIAASIYLSDMIENNLSFLQHKLSAVGSFVGAVDYDTTSALSVSLRQEIHDQTFGILYDEPWRFIVGHFSGLVYWPVDSQVLTYLGSFGGFALILFVLLHLHWLVRGYNCRKNDGYFSWYILLVFFAIFFTNRILDYFPIASLYFLIIGMATSNYRRFRYDSLDPFMAHSNRSNIFFK